MLKGELLSILQSLKNRYFKAHNKLDQMSKEIVRHQRNEQKYLKKKIKLEEKRTERMKKLSKIRNRFP